MMTDVQMLTVIDNVIERLKDPSRWTKGAAARGDHGGQVPYDSDRAKQHCVGATVALALHKVGVHEIVHSTAAYAIHRGLLRIVLNELGSHYAEIAAWNDAPETTHAELIRVLTSFKAEIASKLPVAERCRSKAEIAFS